MIPPQCPNKLSAFLGKITRNLALNRYKYYSREKRGYGQTSLILDELQECIPTSNNTEQIIEEKLLVEVLNHFLYELPMEKRMMFLRRYWYMSSIKEIAKDYEISEGKVKMTLFEVSNDNTTSNTGAKEEAVDTLTHMMEMQIRIDEIFPNGFIGNIKVGTDLFKEGEQIAIVVQDNVTVVQQDGSTFSYNEFEPNIPDSDLEIGSCVWVGFQKYNYVEGNGKYNQIFAYHVVERDDNTATDKESMVELTDKGFPNWGLTLSVKDVPTIIEEYGWNSIAYIIAKNDSTEFEIKWEWLYGKLPTGTYRLTKGFTDFRKSGDYDNFTYWTEFEIK